MKAIFEKLKQLSEEIDFDDFYSITIDTGGVKFQGEFTTAKVVKYQNIGGRKLIKDINDSGHIHLTCDEFDIVLL